MAKEIKKNIAGKMRNERAAAFEREINKQEKTMLRDRAKRIKSGGFSSERDYFTNVNPDTGKRREEKKH